MVIIENTIQYVMKCISCFVALRNKLKSDFIGVQVMPDGRIIEAVNNGVMFHYPDGTLHFIHNNNFDDNGNRIYEQ